MWVAIRYSVSFTLFTAMLFQSCKQDDRSFQKTLILSAREANADLPKMLDANTRFDSVTVRPGKVMCYHYTLVNMDVSNVDIRGVESVFRKQTVDKLNAATNLGYFKKNHVTFMYVFNKDNGDMIFDIKITAKEYK